MYSKNGAYSQELMYLALPDLRCAKLQAASTTQLQPKLWKRILQKERTVSRLGADALGVPIRIQNPVFAWS